MSDEPNPNAPAANPEPSVRPWEPLAELIHGGSEQELAAHFEQIPNQDVALAVNRLDAADQRRLLEILSPEEGAKILQDMPDIYAPDLLDQLEPATLAPIIHTLPSDTQADLVAGLGQPETILELLESTEADQIRQLSQYSATEAGGLMITEYLAYPETWTTHDVIEDLRDHSDRYAGYETQYIYALDDERRLTGVVPVRNLLLTPRNASIRASMIRDPITLLHHTGLDELEQWFARYDFLGLPVVDEAGALLGVLTRRNVLEALSRRADRDALKRQGIVEEELRSMPLWRRSRGRLSWLSVNIVLNMIAASVIAVHQDTLEAVIALAVFLPIISDMSGCSGNQAVAVTMREMTLGLLRPTEILRVLGKELMVGLVNGATLGAMIAAVAWLWKGNAWLGLVVGVAMAANTLIAVSVGGTVPMLIKRFGKDPALASGPLLTTVTDLCGFLIILTLASMLLPRLLGS